MNRINNAGFHCHTLRTFVCLIGAIALAVAFAGVSSAQAPGLYRIDSKASHIEIRVFRSGFFSAFGDNHVIALSRFSGTAKSSGKAWEVDVEGESASLEMKDPNTAASTRTEVQSTMLGPTQLDVTRYPKIEVRATSLVPGGTGQSWRMIADVTLHGVTRRVEFPLAWSQDGNGLRVRGKKKLLLRDFKIEPISKAFGAVQVRNDFDLIYDIVLRRSS
jgi:polyisoprenoid-binding protein YceI